MYLHPLAQQNTLPNCEVIHKFTRSLVETYPVMAPEEFVILFFYIKKQFKDPKHKFYCYDHSCYCENNLRGSGTEKHEFPIFRIFDG